MILVASAALAATLGACCYWLFQRTTSRLTTEELLRHPAIQKLLQQQKNDVTLEVVERLSNPDERMAHKQGFLQGSDFRWIALGGDGSRPKTQTTTADDDDKLHRDVTFYMLECVFRFAELYGHSIVCRQASTGQYLGSIHLIPPAYATSAHWLYKAHFYRAVIPLGQPVPDTCGNPDTAARFAAYAKLDQRHFDVMATQSNDDGRHWYVLNLGVAPAAQGQGIGKLLMNVAKALAAANPEASDEGASAEKKQHWPLFLECHDQNVPFYQKCGFAVAERYEMVPKYKESSSTEDDDSSGRTSYHYNAMVLA